MNKDFGTTTTNLKLKSPIKSLDSNAHNKKVLL